METSDSSVGSSGLLGEATPFHEAHKKSDVDAEPNSQHHTLGRGPNQAAFGNHGHETPSPSNEPPDRPAIGDIWVVTNMDNLRRRWNGLTWEDQVLGDMALGSITADNITAGAIDGEYIYGATLDAGVVNASEIYGSYIEGTTVQGGTVQGTTISGGTVTGTTVSGGTITGSYIEGTTVQGGTITGTTLTGVNVTANLFKSSNGSQRIEIGNTGSGDPVDEIRMFNGGTVVSIRNLSTSPGTMYFSADSIARINFDGLYAKDFIPNSARAYKENIESVEIDHAAVLRRNGFKKWEWKDEFYTKDPEPGNPGKGKKPPKNRADRVDYGLIADDMPDFMQKGDGYSLPAAVGFLWDALTNAMNRIEELERRLNE